jgi:hypothetical protein
MGEETLARRIGIPPCEARELLRLHRMPPLKAAAVGS